MGHRAHAIKVAGLITTQFLPRDARSAKLGIAIVSRPSDTLMLMYRGRIGWTSSKLIARLISLGYSHLGATTSAI